MQLELKKEDVDKKTLIKEIKKGVFTVMDVTSLMK